MKSDSYCECVCKCVGVFPCEYGYVDVCLHKKCSPHLIEEDADDEEGVHAKHGEQVHPYVVLETCPVEYYRVLQSITKHYKVLQSIRGYTAR